jgi:hypothetical protein
MFARTTVRGCVPALLRIKVAMRLSILHLDSAAAMVNPPNNSMMTGLHMAAKTKSVVSLESSRLPSFLTTFKTTQRKGIMRDVTKRGMACEMTWYG